MATVRRLHLKSPFNSLVTIQSHINDRIRTKTPERDERKIVQIETSDRSILNKSIEASRVLGDAFKRLKEFIISHEFASEEEEILFFKEIKPRLFSRLIYYRKIYNIEMNRPVGCIESQKEYLLTEMDELGRYTRKRLALSVITAAAPHTRTASISCAGRPTRNNTWKPSTMNSTRSFRQTRISRWRKSWPTTCCRFILWANWNHWRARTSGTWSPIA